MKITIPWHRFLKQKSLTSTGNGFSWGDADENSYILGDPHLYMSIDPVFELLSIDMPKLIQPEIVKAFSVLTSNVENLPIDGVQSPEKMIMQINKAFKRSRQALEDLQALGYIDTFMECNKTIKRLQRAQVDANSIKAAIKAGKIKNVSVAKGFLPMRDGSLSLPEYSITRTLTGRMTITKGPQILTAPKFIRKFLKSSYPGGKIAQVDFISLEPRVAMQLTEENLGDDIYNYLSEKLFTSKVSRSVVKKLVLCAVYGASEATLKKGLPEDVDIKKIVEKTKELLNYKLVVNQQLESFRKTGKIKNYFGRPITPQGSRESLLYNNFIQSSAVDVALLGFGKILDKAPERVRPIFFIHDAMLIDLHPEDIEEFKKLSSSIFIDELGEFPLEFQLLE